MGGLFHRKLKNPRAARFRAAAAFALFAQMPLCAAVLSPSQNPGTENAVHARLVDSAQISQISGIAEISGNATNTFTLAFGKDADGNGKLDADEAGIVLTRDRQSWKISPPCASASAEAQAHPRAEFEIKCDGGCREMVFKTAASQLRFGYDPSWTFAKASVCGRQGCTVSISVERRRFTIRIVAK